MTTPSYAALLNEREVIPPGTEPYFGVRNYVFQDFMRDRLEKIPFDPPWYLLAYPDVAEAITNGQVADAQTHFVMFGYYEHRMPRPIEVDADWYCKAYPDVEKAVQRGHFASPQDHFNQYGYREGRLPHAQFSLS